MDRKRYEEIKAKVKAAKAVAETVVPAAPVMEEPKGKIFESVDAMIEYLNRND